MRFCFDNFRLNCQTSERGLFKQWGQELCKCQSLLASASWRARSLARFYLSIYLTHSRKLKLANSLSLKLKSSLIKSRRAGGARGGKKWLTGVALRSVPSRSLLPFHLGSSFPLQRTRSSFERPDKQEIKFIIWIETIHCFNQIKDFTLPAKSFQELSGARSLRNSS